eukprot:gene1681-2529_t
MGLAAAAGLLLLLASRAVGEAIPGVVPAVHIGGRWVEMPVAEFAAEGNEPAPIIPVERGRTMHVMISSFRDSLCPRTLVELFNYSRNPELVTVGIVEQVLPGDPDCVKDYCEAIIRDPSPAVLREMQGGGSGCPFESQIRVLARNAKDSGGPMHARSFGRQLLRDEVFCLQIDSHSRAIQNWDSELIKEWSYAENEYAILSTYVQREEDLKSRTDGSNINRWREVPIMCRTVSGAFGMVRNDGAAAGRALPRPLRSCFWGAGLSFGKCHMELRVPHDPSSVGVFDGEEFTRAARMWTHGYDLFAPTRGLIFHDYTKAQSDPKRWQHFQSRHLPNPGIAYKRLKHLLNMPGGEPQDLGLYGLGTRRSLAQYEELCQLNLTHSPVGKGLNCGRLKWVPWDFREDLASIAREVQAINERVGAKSGAESPAPTAARADNNKVASFDVSLSQVAANQSSVAAVLMLLVALFTGV